MTASALRGLRNPGYGATTTAMPLFRVIGRHEDLPPIGPTTRAAEAQTIDFKSGYDPSARAEMAKDIAAFANALGGVILIGTSRDHEPLAFPGIPRAIAEEVKAAFGDAHTRHLSPKPPVIESVIFPAPPPAASDRFLLAVNVHPYADQIVGARVAANVWRFPIRVGTDTNDLEPAMLPLYTTAVRRNIILLGNIQPDDNVRLCFRNPHDQRNANPEYVPIRIHDIDVPRNALVFTLENDSTTFQRIPLDDVERVWDSGQFARSWIVRVLGHMSGTGGRVTYHSNPSNAVVRI